MLLMMHKRGQREEDNGEREEDNGEREKSEEDNGECEDQEGEPNEPPTPNEGAVSALSNEVPKN